MMIVSEIWENIMRCLKFFFIEKKYVNESEYII